MTPTGFCLQRKSQPPYGGLWNLNRPEVGIVGTGYIFEILVNNCKKWRRANGWPVGLGFEAEVETACCEDKPDHCLPCDPKLHPRQLTFGDVLTGTSTMLSLMRAGRPLETQEEAERRATICAKCAFNVPFKTPCSGICESLKRLVASIVGHAKTSKDDQLKSCFFCGCFLKSAVWVPLKLQVDVLSEKQRKSLDSVPHCWKKLPA